MRELEHAMGRAFAILDNFVSKLGVCVEKLFLLELAYKFLIGLLERVDFGYVGRTALFGLCTVDVVAALPSTNSSVIVRVDVRTESREETDIGREKSERRENENEYRLLCQFDIGVHRRHRQDLCTGKNRFTELQRCVPVGKMEAPDEDGCAQRVGRIREYVAISIHRSFGLRRRRTSEGISNHR